ncbi:MAG: ComEC/Rec2 family competence protein [Rhodospirillaceae bacterium]|nr:ComEC/Rec2 family competence protein [Rhodospirillaceae bacterium]MDE0618867.1 ComEC/Rec2 family competence protein [Rhodospirillaceae bacterium]
MRPIPGWIGQMARMRRCLPEDAGGVFGRAAGLFAGGLAARLSDERERWLLWSPAAVGLGVFLYFSGTAEPALSMALALPAIAAVVLGAGWRRELLRFPAFLLLLCAIGYAAAAVRTWSVEAPAISRKIGPVTVTGRVVAVDPLRHGARAVLDDLAIGRLAAAETPERVRLTVRLGWTGLRPGRTVMLRAVLLPVRPPVAPGAADFQRRAYFERIGASGFAVTAPVAVREARTGWLDSRIERLRDTAMRRIGAVLSGDAGAVAAALLTGHRGGISPETMTAIRNAGLAHLLAISGLHIGMIAGIAFFALWFGLALVPGAALRWPTRKIAAIGALAVAAGYLLLTGATIPTQRAFLMLAVVMAGVLVGRVAISMRLVAAAATVLLLLSPESLPTPSFQMSFAAVVALVAAYEAWSIWRMRNRTPRLPRPVRALVGIGAASLIAGAATGPFALFHFHRLAMYGLAANLAAVPIVSFFVLPMGLLALFAMPFGLEAGPLWLMARGIDLMLWVAHGVAGLPGALALAPAPLAWGMALIVAGGLWLTIWQRRWRFAGVAAIAAGLASSLTVAPPDILVSPEVQLVATRTADGALAVSSARRGRFIARVWREGEAQRRPRFWHSDRLSRVRCDPLGCIYRLDGRLIAFPADPAALAEDCRRAFMIVADFDVRRRCPTVPWAIDRRTLMRNGSYAIGISAGRVTIRTDRDVRGDRPWVSRPPMQTRQIRLARGRAVADIR